MKKDEHRDQTLSFFRQAALEKDGYYDAKDSKSPKHSIWQRLVRWILTRRLARAATTHTSVVDVGCGNGDFVHQLARRFPGVTFCGHDLSPEMIGVAKDRSPETNLSFAVADLLAVEPGTRKHDLVLCHNMFHHLHPDDVEQGLQSLDTLSFKSILFEIKPKECWWNRRFRPDSLFPLHLVSRGRIIKFFEERGFAHTYTWNIFFLPFFSPISVLEFRRKTEDGV